MLVHPVGGQRREIVDTKLDRPLGWLPASDIARRVKKGD